MASSAPVLLSVLLAVCTAFNLDPLVSVVKSGGRRSLFGFSVALHQDLSSGAYRLLVGAPMERAEPGVLANRTGGVYVCPISSDPGDCTRVTLLDSEQLLSEDLIEDMWLGVSVASQGPPGGRVLACGHRFAKLYGAYRLRHMTGRCYVRGNHLQYNDSDAHWQNPDQVCSHLGDVSGEVMCTMGMSAAISQTEIIVGSPGSFDWQGNVHVLWMNPEVMFDTKKTTFTNMEQRNIYIGYSVALAPRLLSQQLDSIITGAPKDSKHDARGSVFLALKSSSGLQILQRLRGEQTGSYYGNALAVLDLNNDGYVFRWNDLLVGAPFFFQRLEEVGGAVYVYLNTGGRFDSRPTLVLRGPQHSAFGMSLCAAGDLDQDGFQDFVVGAPFHGSGSVMVFNTGPGGVPSRPSQVIQGSSISPVFRTFGFSLAPAQDVDQNHHPDVLIGSLDDSVVLLRSRPVVELTQTLRVSPDVVDPNDCESCIRVKVCFSYTFRSGGSSDKDNITLQFSVNADVTSLNPRVRFSSSGQSLVWSYLSMPKAHCTTLRATLLTPIRDQVQPLVFSLNASMVQKLPKKHNGLFDLRQFPVTSRPLLPVRHQIHIQKACGHDNRCHSNLQMTAEFTDEKHRPLDVAPDTLSLSHCPCLSASGGHQRLVLDSSLNLLLLHVNVTNLHYNTLSPWRLAEDAHSVALNVTVPPCLVYSGVRAQGASQAVECTVEGGALLCDLGNPLKANQQVEVWIRFQTSEDILRSREITSRLQLSTLSEQWDLFPLTVSMLVEVSLQASLTLLNPPDPVYFSGHVTGESAVKTTSDIGSLVTFHFQVHRSGRALHHLGNLMLVFDWPLELSNGKWLLYLSQIEIPGSSEELCSPSTALNPLKLTVTTTRPSETHGNYHPTLNPLKLTVTTPRPSETHGNYHPTLNPLKLTVTTTRPSETHGNYHPTLNPLKLTVTTTRPSETHGNYHPTLNPLKLTVSDEEEVRRKKRNLQQDFEEKETTRTAPILHLQSPRRTSLTLSCEFGARCVRVECPLIDVNSTVTLTVRARLWNATFLEDFMESSSVSVFGAVTLQLQTEEPAVNMRPQRVQFSVRVFPDRSLPVAPGAPLGVLLLSAVGGVSLLAVICLLLWKCGFFVRRGPWPATLHQGTMSSRASQHSRTDADGFLIQNSPPDSKRKKHWVTTYSQ
ncbi:integrin alpha-3-like [Periophthalmus magnuspinnatus]|uniref:integrin alpha-3-like n=1 Tax=Periophthalmus magnuspinnatus TaxID=409849 RepID=UPI0024365E0D|nr:integrin alpha-3-like [Periophthalmus magnuspinnatus]